MKTWQNTDKTEWPRGEWDSEPDKAHWVDDATGLDCLIVRNGRGHGGLCGYVGVPAAHLCFGVDYDGVDVDVHGGLTFSDHCSPSEDESSSICHPKEGAANENVWWLGFDCAHAGDYCPGHTISFGDDIYRSFDFVAAEVARLALQLKDMRETA